MFKNFLTLLNYEIKSTLRQPFSWLTPLLFFVIAVSLFPLALGSDNLLLKKIAPGVIWVTALLATIISINDLFREDFEQGNVDLLLLSSNSLTLTVLIKITSHWLTHCLPLILVSPVLGLLMNLSGYEELILCFTLALGTPVFIFLGAIGAALIVGIRGHGLLLPILVVPFYIPVLVFGTSAIIAASSGQPINGYLAIIGALLFGTAAFAPLLAGMALKMGVDQ